MSQTPNSSKTSVDRSFFLKTQKGICIWWNPTWVFAKSSKGSLNSWKKSDFFSFFFQYFCCCLGCWGKVFRQEWPPPAPATLRVLEVSFVKLVLVLLQVCTGLLFFPFEFNLSIVVIWGFNVREGKWFCFLIFEFFELFECDF